MGNCIEGRTKADKIDLRSMKAVKRKETSALFSELTKRANERAMLKSQTKRQKKQGQDSIEHGSLVVTYDEGRTKWRKGNVVQCPGPNSCKTAVRFESTMAVDYVSIEDMRLIR
mmetsp:Transcript_8324/g.13498  ORF Transcript_8324/g.13498 Transcript_8324/m.13498 type:complete len:114 (+) Transcript_8324:81-422(+)